MEKNNQEDFFELKILQKGDIKKLMFMTVLILGPISGFIDLFLLAVLFVLSRFHINVNYNIEGYLIFTPSIIISFATNFYLIVRDNCLIFKSKMEAVVSKNQMELIERAKKIKSDFSKCPDIQISTTTKMYLEDYGYWSFDYINFSYEDESYSIPEYCDDLTIENFRERIDDAEKVAVYIDEILLKEKLEKDLSQGKKTKRIKI